MGVAVAVGGAVVLVGAFMATSVGANLVAVGDSVRGVGLAISTLAGVGVCADSAEAQAVERSAVIARATRRTDSLVILLMFLTCQIVRRNWRSW